MNKTDQISDELINSFVDGQLSAEEKSQLLEAANADPALGAQICDTQRLKAMVSHAYQRTPPSSRRHAEGTGAFLKHRSAIAAGLMLAAGALSGWFAHNWWDPAGLENASREVHYFQPSQLATKWTGQQKVVLHIGSADPRKLKAGLDHTEYLLDTYRQAGRSVQMELVVSGGGLDLLRADVSPYAERIRSMKQAYGNLTFIACNQTLERLRKEGVEVRLLPEASLVQSSALEEVISRLREGWTYVSI